MIRAALALARRALRTTLRRPQFVAPLIIFPTLLLAINVGGLHRTTDLPGFPPVRGFLDFQIAAAIVQSLMFAGVNAGIASALEIEGGYFDRLVASPIPRVSIVLGRILAGGVLAIGQVAWFLALGLLFGAHIEAGVLGVLVCATIAVTAAIGFAALGVMLALRTKNASTVQGIFPLIFVVLFVSSAFFPANLLSSPADAVAEYNPLSYIADGMRDPIISGISAEPVIEGMLAATGLALAGIALSVLALRGRLRDA